VPLIRSFLLGPDDPSAIEMIRDGETIVQQQADVPNFGVTMRVRRNAPAGQRSGILSYSEKTSVVLPFTLVFTRGNSLTAAQEDYDAVAAVLTDAERYWTRATGTQVFARRRFNDQAAYRYWTVIRGELYESEHGFPEAWGWIVATLRLHCWEGQVS